MAYSFTSPQRIIGTPNADAEAPQVVRSGDNIFVLWHEFPEPTALQPDIFLARSTDKGVAFKPRINLSNSPAEFSADEDIAVSGNRVYVVWVEGGEIAFRRDRENDGTFSNKIALNDPALGVVTRPQIVASGNNVFVVWETELTDAAGNIRSDIFFARSTDGGDSFKNRTNISANAGDSFAPQIALLPDDRVLVTWRDFSGGQGAEIFFTRGQP